MLSRETWAEVSLSTIESNYEHAKKEINDHEILPVLKANAYGHGLNQVSRLFDDIKLPFLCVASLDEAYQLMDAGVEHDILIFSYLDPSFVLKNNRNNLIFTIPSLEWYEKVKGKARFHLEINSGMNRMGIKTIEDAKAVMDASHGDVEGIYTHFSSSVYDEKSVAQAKRFTLIYEALNHKFDYVHAGNISVKLFNELEVFDSMRLGLGLFGYRHDLDTKPSLKLFTNVIYLTEVEESETVGYNYEYLATKQCRVASIPIGYADGFDKRQKNLEVWINNKAYPLVGGICMDQSMVLVDDSISIGDKVELLGDHRTMKAICDSYDTSAYEVLVAMGPRITRSYK